MASNSGRILGKNCGCHSGLGAVSPGAFQGWSGQQSRERSRGWLRGNVEAALGGGVGVDLAGSFKDNLWSELERGLGSILELNLFTKCRHNFNPRGRYKNGSNWW